MIAVKIFSINPRIQFALLKDHYHVPRPVKLPFIPQHGDIMEDIESRPWEVVRIKYCIDAGEHPEGRSTYHNHRIEIHVRPVPE